MASLMIKPTRSETTVEQRHLMVQFKAQGWTYPAIAAEFGVSRWTVMRWVHAAHRAGPAALGYKPRRPHTPHPQTTPPAVVARIQAIREQHPGWGARLIQRQLALEGTAPIPSEVTIHAWLGRLGFALVRPPTGKPLGWSRPQPERAKVVWQVDFKKKGGTGTSASSTVTETGRASWSNRRPRALHPSCSPWPRS